jgi:hypothetical protein
MYALSDLKKLNYRHYVCVFISAGFLLCGVFFFQISYLRFFNSVRDLGLSLAFYFCDLFGIGSGIVPTVTAVPANNLTTLFPVSASGFTSKISLLGDRLISPDNFNAYFKGVGAVSVGLLQLLLLFSPLIFMCVLLFQNVLKRENNDYNADSKPLKIFKRISSVSYVPVKRFAVAFFDFLKEHANYFKLWVFLWLLNFNLITIVLEFFAFAFYFVVRFDVGNLYIQVYKLFLDLSVVFGSVPLWAWVVLALLVLDLLRKKIALSRLRRFERRDRLFIEELPVVSMVVGTMGKKKTTMLTDMALSQAVMFRDRAFEGLLDNDLKFPHFPFINLELELKRAMRYHQLFNLATCKAFIDKKYNRFLKRSCAAACFGYDYEKYGLTYDDKLKVAGLFDVLKTYAQLYFIYIIQTSFLISNYSIRADSILADVGNFPMWDSDFFNRDSRRLEAYSRHSHILDFDALRLGKKILEDNIKANSFEFGVVVITEGGKERGNMLDVQGLKKSADETNQKNDLFNLWLKMVRHSATVDNYPFVKVLIDEQRPESMGADVRELCDIVHICDTSKNKLAMPFFFIAELLYDFVLSRFRRFYYDYRFARGDNTLTLYLYKKIAGVLNSHYRRIYNRFSFFELSVAKEKGTLDGNREAGIYYLMSKKIYSKRFSTDCFSDYFAVKVLRSPLGLSDLREYQTEKAGFEELKIQHSYFIDDLFKQINI